MFISGASTKRSFLLHNDGNMHFSDVTAKAKLPAEDFVRLTGLGGAVGDVNGDGWPDFLSVSSVRKTKLMPPDIRLYINNRDGTFRLCETFDFSKAFPLFGNGEDSGRGAAFGDLNGDGKIDIVIGHHYGMPASPALKGRDVLLRVSESGQRRIRQPAMAGHHRGQRPAAASQQTAARRDSGLQQRRADGHLEFAHLPASRRPERAVHPVQPGQRCRWRPALCPDRPGRRIRKGMKIPAAERGAACDIRPSRRRWISTSMGDWISSSRPACSATPRRT